MENWWLASDVHLLLPLQDCNKCVRVYVNCFCPGWVKTQMTNWEGNMSAEEGAETGMWVVLLPVENISSGNFMPRDVR
jgi:carbonyl reductase 1